MHEFISFLYFTGSLDSQIMGAAVLSLIGALIVILVARFVMGEAPAYPNAYGATFLAALAYTLFRFGMFQAVGGRTVKWLVIGVGYVLQTLVYLKVLRYPDGRKISFKQALVISTVQFGFVLLLMMIISALVLIAIIIAYSNVQE